MKFRKSDRIFIHTEYANSAFSPLLRRIANQLPPNERKPPKAKPARHSYNVAVSDDEALRLLRRIVRGERLVEVARGANLRPATLRQWHAGVMRPHLMRQIDAEHNGAQA